MVVTTIVEEGSLNAQDSISVVSGPMGVGPETSVSVTTAETHENETIDSTNIRDKVESSVLPVSSSTVGTEDAEGGKKKKKKKGSDSDNKEDESASKSKGKSKKSSEVTADTTRELLQIKITSIQISDLIPAHRFKKNSPWLKVDYGEKHWEHPYQHDTQGVKADFYDLEWDFILQRDTRHRNDLIVTVCSADVIVGRYMLAASEFMNMPVTKSGYFKVNGKVVNAMGIAGKIIVVFKKAIAEPPKAPRFIEATPYTVKANTLPHDTRSYIRVISIACADLKPIKTFELNSPYVQLTCGHEWKKTTDVQVGVGLSAKWNRLPWKLVMDKFYSLFIEVMSERELIGMVQLTLDELRNVSVDENGFTEIIRQLTDGSTFSGRIRILLFIQEMPSNADANTYHVDVPGLPYAEEYSREQQLTARGDIYARAKPPVNAALSLSSNLIRGAITYCPFVMRVSEAGCFDTKKCDPLRPNSLSISAACGGWGGSTFTVKNCGSDAYWVGLSANWRFIVDDGSKLHLNVWSRNAFVGSVTLSAREIMKNPIDPDGSTEIMLILKDEGKSTGRMRINCVFEYFRKGENTNYDPQPEAVVYVPPRAKKMEVDAYGEVPKYNLPAIAKVISISVVDLKSVHLVAKNSPRVKIVCDRKQALTTVMNRAGKSARWVDLDWDIPINEGCIMMIYCYSGDIQIGFMELNAHLIVEEPLDNYGMTVVSAFIRDHDGMSTGKLTIIFQLENVPDLDVYDSIVNGVDKDPYNVVKTKISHVVNEEIDPVLELMATQPFFSLKDATETGTGIMLSVQIIELDCTDLDAVHYFGKKNSPMVSAACGRWADTTSVQPNAGEATYWTGLDWKFLMDDQLNVQFVVGSGTKVIGSVKSSAKQFSVQRADQRGVKRVTLNMFKDKRGHPHFTGRLKVTYKLGVVRESQYIKRPRAIERIHVEELNIPFNAIVTKVVARGMPKVHTVGPNEPRFRMSYDDWSKTTSVCTTGDSEEAAWEGQTDLPTDEWTCSVCNEEMPFTFTMISSSELIGIAEVSAADVMAVPRTVRGVAEVVVTLMKNGKSNGRLQVFLKLINDKVAGPEISPEEEDAEQERLAAEEDKARERQQYWEAKQKLLGNDTIKNQQQQMESIISYHQLEKQKLEETQAETIRRVAAQAAMNRTRIETDMLKKGEEVLAIQHKMMLAEPLPHKYAPVGEYPAGYVPPDEHIAKLLKGSGLEGNDDDDYSEGFDPNGVIAFPPEISPTELAELQVAVTKETQGFQFRIKSDLQVAKEMVAAAGWTGFVVVFEDDAGDIQLVKVHQESLPQNSTASTSLKTSNPARIPNSVRLAGDDNSVLGMQDFDDDGSVVHAPTLKSSAKLINTKNANIPDFEGNLDDDASIAYSKKVSKNSTSNKSNKIAPLIDNEIDELSIIEDDGMVLIEKAGKLVKGGIAADSKAKAKTYDKSGLISNKFTDLSLDGLAHTKSRAVASAFALQIKGVAVLDVPSMHMMKKNSLKAVVTCTGAAAGVDGAGLSLETTEPVEYSTEVMELCGDIANWVNLTFDFPTVHGRRRQHIIIDISSGDKHVATVEWKTDDLYTESLIEKPGAVVRKFGELRDGSTFRGKIKLQYAIKAL